MLILLILVAAALLVYYAKLKYFTLRGGLPGLAPHFFFGNLIQSGILFHGTSPVEVQATFKRRFGDIFQFWLGPSRLIVVSGIGDVQHIFTHRSIYDQGDLFNQQFSVMFPDGLICLRGTKYKRHASITLPLFRRGKIISNLDVIVDCVDKLLAKWRLDASKKVHLDIVQQSQNLLLAIFGLIGFDYDLETLDGDTCNNELTHAFHDLLSTFQMLIYSPTILSTIYLKLSRRHRRAQAIIERYFSRMIEQELAENAESVAKRKRTSLIASLVASLQKDENAEAVKSEEVKKGLSRSELLHEMLFFLVAGSETTASAVTWFIHFMSKYPRIQHKIKTELTDNSDKQDLSLDRLDSLVYLDCVIKEVLRYCPPINATVRTLTVDDRLPESGAQLFKGDQVFVPLHNLARDTRYWSIDPDLFYPERFLNEDKNHHPYAFIPFGSGHRQCIAQDLARFELKVIAARLMQYVTFGDGGPQVNAGGHLFVLTIVPRHVGVTIAFD